MNYALARSIVGSLRVTGSCEEPLVKLIKFGRLDWQRTLPWLADSGLALYFLKRASHSDLHDALPAQIRDHLRRNLANNRRRIAEMKTEFGSLNLYFKAAGVEYVVLKGFALVPDYCPDASL